MIASIDPLDAFRLLIVAADFFILGLMLAVWYRNKDVLGTLNPAGPAPKVTGGANSPDNRAGPKGPGGATTAPATEAPGFPGR